MCQRLPGRNWYRIALGKEEWFQSRKEYLRTLLCFLDCLLFVLYLIGIAIAIVLVYLLCVGIGYPIIRKTANEPVDIWLVGAFFGLLILLVISVCTAFIIICFQGQSEDFLLPHKTYERVNQTESEFSSSIQIQQMTLY